MISEIDNVASVFAPGRHEVWYGKNMIMLDVPHADGWPVYTPEEALHVLYDARDRLEEHNITMIQALKELATGERRDYRACRMLADMTREIGGRTR